MSLAEPLTSAERQARRARRRRALEKVVEKALARLDRLDGDPDLENGGDDEPSADPEPSLCGVSVGPGGDPWGPYLDLEQQCDDEGELHGDREPDTDDEDTHDREEDRSDYEPDCDGEGRVNPLWTIGGRDMWEVHGCDADPLTTERPISGSLAGSTHSAPRSEGRGREGVCAPRLRAGGGVLDPDETACPDDARAELGMGSAS